jgi:hypothetical protein
MLTFCSHAECLDEELQFLVEVDATISQQSQVHSVSYRRLSARFRRDFAGQAVHREP